MDKIWDRKSFEVGVYWLLWRGWKTEWPRRTDKSRTVKKKRRFFRVYKWWCFVLSFTIWSSSHASIPTSPALSVKHSLSRLENTGPGHTLVTRIFLWNISALSESNAPWIDNRLLRLHLTNQIWYTVTQWTGYLA